MSSDQTLSTNSNIKFTKPNPHPHHPSQVQSTGQWIFLFPPVPTISRQPNENVVRG